MTTPDNPDPTEADPTELIDAAAPSGGADPDAAPADGPAAAPADTDPALAAPVDAGAPDGASAAADVAATDDAAGSDAGAPDVAETETTAAEVGAGEPLASGGGTDGQTEAASANGVASGPGSAGWVNTAAPPWQRAGTSVPSVDQPTVTIRVDEAEQSRPADVPPPPVEPKKRFSGAYGFSPGVGPGRSDAANRYVHPVSQPMRDQGPGAGQDYSQPTVRIGGYGQFDQAASAPPQPSAASRIRSSPRLPRRASLQLRYLEPWSVLKISLVLSVAGFLAWMVAVGILYGVLAGMGVWDQLNGTYSDLTSLNDPQAGAPLISAGGVFGVATLIGLVNIVLITAMCTVGAFIYNVSADLAGGIEVTLSERD